jgi:hypothetical protein
MVYDPQLTLDLPRAERGGTAMNAPAHCAEALYAEVCSPLRVWAAARSRRPRGWVARGGGSDCEPAGRTREPEAGLATADLRALPLHLVKGDRPVSRRRGVYIIDGSDDADVDGWKNAATCSCLSAAALNSSDERNLK